MDERADDQTDDVADALREAITDARIRGAHSVVIALAYGHGDRMVVIPSMVIGDDDELTAHRLANAAAVMVHEAVAEVTDVDPVEAEPTARAGN